VRTFARWYSNGLCPPNRVEWARWLGRLTYRLPRPLVSERGDFAVLLNRRGLLGCGVEVGVKRGEFSQSLLDVWNGRHLLSVDPWTHAAGDGYIDVANVPQAEHDRYFRETVARLRPFGQRSTVLRMTGDGAAARVPHHSLDFVYLDARHDSASVRSDLRQWFPKVRPGGVLAGHDYVDGLLPQGLFGVRSAVDSFCRARRIRVTATFADGEWPSWYVMIPKRSGIPSNAPADLAGAGESPSRTSFRSTSKAR
jgi:hypothetical protein